MEIHLGHGHLPDDEPQDDVLEPLTPVEIVRRLGSSLRVARAMMHDNRALEGEGSPELEDELEIGIISDIRDVDYEEDEPIDKGNGRGIILYDE